jgi:hypothetical protein
MTIAFSYPKHEERSNSELATKTKAFGNGAVAEPFVAAFQRIVSGIKEPDFGNIS